MTIDHVVLFVLRGFGALWVVGAIVLLRQLWFNAKLDPMIAALESAAKDLGASPDKKIDLDNGRERWLTAGALLTLCCGVAMALGHRLAVPLLAALIVQQLLYFIRQRHRELRQTNPVDAFAERPTKETVNGFYASLLAALLAAWLSWRDQLW